MITSEKIVTARAKAFTGQGVATHKFMVDGNVVRVWDSVAGHYTTCHILGPSAIRRIRAMAS